MMLEGSVKVDHEEDDQRKREVHHKEYASSSAIFYQLVFHSLSGSVFSRVSEQKEAHYAKADIVCTERAEPKGTVINSKAQLEYCI